MKKQIVITLEYDNVDNDGCYFGKLYGVVGKKHTDDIRSVMAIDLTLDYFKTQISTIEKWMEQIG